MGKLQVVSGASEANKAMFVGTDSPANLVNNKNRRVYLHSISAAPRGANWAADVELYLFDTFNGVGDELVTDGDMAPNLEDASYTSDFTSTVDGWTDIAGAAMTITANQTIDSVEDCLKCVADGGGDESSFVVGGEIWGVAGKAYELKFDYFAETGGNMSFWGGGLGAGSTTIRFDEGAGQQVTVVENAWTTAKLYITGGTEAADIHLTAFTAKGGETADTLAANKYVAFKNVTIRELTNKASWTQGEDWVVNFALETATKGTAATTALAQTLTAPVAGEIYKSVYTLTEAATGITPSFAGTGMPADEGAGTFTEYFVASDTTASLTYTADASAIVTLTDVSMKKMTGLGTGTYFMKDSIRSGTTLAYNRDFESKQPWSRNGWGLYLTTGGSACIMDLTMTYEVV
jgi:hypothetical protein